MPTFKHFKWFCIPILALGTVFFVAPSQLSAAVNAAGGAQETALVDLIQQNQQLEKEVADLKAKVKVTKEVSRQEKAVPTAQKTSVPKKSDAKAEKAAIRLEQAREKERAEALKLESVAKRPEPPKDLKPAKTEVAEKKKTDSLIYSAPKNVQTPSKHMETQPAAPAGTLDVSDCLMRSVAVSLPKEIGEKHLKMYKWTLTKAIRDLFPETTFNFIAENGRLTSGPYTDRHYYFDVKQPMFRGFQLVNTVMQEKYNRRSSIEEIKKAVNESIYNTLVSYFELTRADWVYKNHLELKKQADHLLAQSASKKEKGIISEIEFLNLQYLYAEVATRVEMLLGEKEVAAVELKKNLRIPPDEPIEIEPIYDYSSYKPEPIEKSGVKIAAEEKDLKISEARTLDDYILLAYKNRPELKMEENKLLASRYAEKVAKGGWLPRSDLTMKLGQDATGMRPVVERANFKNEWSIGVETSWNLAGNTVKHNYSNTDNPPSVTAFQGQSGTTRLNNTFSAGLLDGLKQFADVQQAKAQTLEQLKLYEDAEDQTVQDIIEGFYRYRSAVVRLKAAAASLEYRRRAADLAKLKLDKNEIQNSEYLESLQDLTQTRDEFHTSMADYFSSKAKLNYAVGVRDLVPMSDIVDLSKIDATKKRR